MIVRYYESDDRAGLLRRKDDRTPLTKADLEAHRMLSAGLKKIAPALPLLSEESDADEIANRREWDTFWMVDPLDGTREFLERTGQFTINVALIQKQRPVFGLIFEPLKQAASVGVVGEGAWRFQRAGDCWENSQLCTREPPARQLTVLASHRHDNPLLDSCLSYLSSSYELERLNSGSALKFCDLAAGRGDCYPRFSLCSEWDVAAGDALVTAAGGCVLGMDGQPLVYNNRDTLLSPNFLAIGDPRLDLWGNVLEALKER